MEVNGRNHGDEVFDALRIQRREAQTQYAALTNPEHIESIQAMRLQYMLHAAGDMIVDVVGQRREPVGSIGITPVDEINVQAFGQKAPNQRTILLQIHHVRSVDERVHNQQRRRRRRPRDRLVTIEFDLT